MGKGKSSKPYIPEPVNPTPPVEEASIDSIGGEDAMFKDRSRKRLNFRGMKPEKVGMTTNTNEAGLNV